MVFPFPAFPLIPVFFTSLFCSLVPCEPNFGQPAIPDKPDTTKTRSYESSYNSIDSLHQDGNRNLVVFTKSGAVEGYYMQIINGNQIYAFEGIPYAEDTKGDRRWEDPVPKAPWSGILEAKKPGPLCLQFHLLKIARISGSEDCLSMNIYTPHLPSHSNYQGKKYNTGLPVIIWIHGGGGWFGGGSESGPSYLLQDDVILVTINYRLGILGFLSTGDSENPGNYGLKDQSLAIKWVSENIQNFGGNPSKIIVMGVSSGGVFAHLHLMSPMSKHLIAGAVSLSGSAFNHWSVASQEKTQRLKLRLANNIGCPTDSKNLMICIRNMNPYLLMNAQRRLFDYLVFPVIIYHAVVEPEGPGAFLTDTPENLYARNEVAPLPWISSQATDEADAIVLLYNNTGTANLLLRNWNRNARDVLDFRYVVDNTTEVTEKINNFYLRSKTPRRTTPSVADISEMVTDRFFRVGIHRSLQYHSRIAPTYAMKFGFKSEVGFVSIWGEDPLMNGVGHGTDAGFYFNSSRVFLPLKVGTPSYDISRMLINLVNNFAYTGEPQLRYSNGKVKRIWKPIENPYNIRYLLVDNNNVKNIKEPRTEAIRFWENLGLWETSPNPFQNYHTTPISQNKKIQYEFSQSNWL